MMYETNIVANQTIYMDIRYWINISIRDLMFKHYTRNGIFIPMQHKPVNFSSLTCD